MHEPSSPPLDPSVRVPPHLFHPVAIDPTGRAGPTRGRAAGRGWRRVGQNLYVPAEADGSVPEQRIVEATAHLPEGGAVTGWAALRLAGAAYFDGRSGDGGPRPIPLAVGRRSGRRRRPGIVHSYERLLPGDVTERLGVPVTVPDVALFHELREPPFERDAVVAAEMALAAGLTTLDRMWELVVERSSWNRSPWARHALQFATDRSRSPNESRLRLIWMLDAGLAPPLVNQPVFTRDGEFVCIADLLDPAAGLVVEYDGAAHRDSRRHASDVARAERIRQVGLEVTVVTGADLPRRALVVRRLLDARDRSRFVPERLRAWTLQEPPGWRAPWDTPDRRSA